MFFGAKKPGGSKKNIYILLTIILFCHKLVLKSYLDNLQKA